MRTRVNRRKSQRSSRVFLPLTAILAAAVIVGTIAILWSRGEDQGEPEADRSLSETADRASDRGRKEKNGLDGRAAADRLPSPEEERIEREALQRKGVRLAVEVVDKISGEPVTTYQLHLRDANVRLRKVLFFQDTINDPDGRCSIPLEQAGRYTVDVRSRRHIAAGLFDIVVPPEPDLTAIRVELDPGEGVSGQVVDDETGAPVPGALLIPENVDHLAMVLGDTEAGPLAWSDSAGRFRLEGLEALETRLIALHPDYAEGVLRAKPGSGEAIEFKLKRGFQVFGTVLNDAGLPAAGVAIERWLNGTETKCAVLSNAAGGYRTWPVAPGRVDIEASETEGKSTIAPGFSTEAKSAEIKDRDVQLDFGPSAEFVTWSGKLVDPTGLPTDGVFVWLSLIKALSGPTPHRTVWRKARCGSESRFSFRKIVPGRYKVSIEFPGDCMVRMEEKFETPGRCERDLILDCGAIRGEIVNEDTGLRVEGRKCWVSAFTSQSGTSFSQGAIIDGLICIRGVEPGIYTLLAKGNKIAKGSVSGIVVESGKITEGVRISTPTGGMLEVVFSGFSREDEVKVLMEKRKGQGIGILGTRYSERTISLQEGTWDCRIRRMRGRKRIGTINRIVTIHCGETTLLRVSASDFEAAALAVTVEGLVFQADGQPLADTDLTLHGRNIVEIPKGERTITGRTGPDGTFHVEGLRAGKWTVTALIRDGTEKLNCPLDLLVIPEKATSPFFYEAVVPSAKVHGTVSLDTMIVDLVETNTDEICWITLQEVDTSRWHDMAAVPVENDDGRFRFAFPFVQEGDWNISISAMGHEGRKFPIVSLRQGEDHSCGDVRLRPLDGVLVEQVNAAGEPIPGHYVFLDHPNGLVTRCNVISEGKSIHTDIAYGKWKASARCKGYKEKDFTIELNPGAGIKVIRVVMERE